MVLGGAAAARNSSGGHRQHQSTGGLVSKVLPLSGGCLRLGVRSPLRQTLDPRSLVWGPELLAGSGRWLLHCSEWRSVVGMGERWPRPAPKRSDTVPRPPLLRVLARTTDPQPEASGPRGTWLGALCAPEAVVWGQPETRFRALQGQTSGFGRVLSCRHLCGLPTPSVGGFLPPE